MRTAVGRRISVVETASLVAASIVAGGMFTSPRLLVGIAGRSGGVAALLLALFAVGWAAVMARAAQHLSVRSIPQVLMDHARWLGIPWLLFAALFEIVFCATSLREFAGVTTTVFNPMSSSPVLVTLIAASAFTAARHRLEGVARVVFVFFAAFALIAVFSFVVLLMRASDQVAVLPGGPVALGPLLNADAAAFFMISGLSALPFLTFGMDQRGYSAPVWGAGAAGAVMLLAYAATIATGGTAYVLSQIWPVVGALRTLIFREFFINRFGLIVLFAWTGVVISFVAIRLWVFAEAVCLVGGWPGRRAVVAAVGGLLAVAVSQLPDSAPSIQAIAIGVVSPWGMAVILGWLPLAALAYWRDGRRIARALG